MSNNKYNDSVWKEKLWEQIDEELKKRQVPTAHFEVTIILLSPKF
jgi:hypothetical protein